MSDECLRRHAERWYPPHRDRAGDASIPIGDRRVVGPQRAAGDYIVISITDTGMGIAATDLQRIFEPFFTTKAYGMGTGLGLSICRRIVTAHGGHIEVESQVGTGTTVRIMLPPMKE